MENKKKVFKLPEIKVTQIHEEIIATSGEYAVGNRFGFSYDGTEDEGTWGFGS